MSNIIPFPTHRKNTKETHKFKTIGDWTVSSGTITFTDINGEDIKIDLGSFDLTLNNLKCPDYTSTLLDELQECVERDPLVAEYINSNLERLIKVIKK